MNMFNIHIVEDDRDTLEQLRLLLNEVFPKCHIESATTVQQGVQNLERAYNLSTTVDAVVLDFRLPRTFGENPEIDIELCKAVRNWMPGTLVVHVTSYLDDELVVDHVMRAHNSPDDKRFIISKSDPRWGDKLVEELERYLYSYLLNAEMDELFDGEMNFAISRRLKREGHLTHQLAGLKLHLQEYWPKPLDERLRERVKKHFRVEGNEFILKTPERSLA